jgi:hypothetical protein
MQMGLFDFLKKPAAAMLTLSADAQSLFAEVGQDENGELVKIRAPGQVIWDTNGKQFVDEKGAGKEGRWKAAIEELVAADLIGPIGMSPHRLYLITKRGAAVARSAAARPAV